MKCRPPKCHRTKRGCRCPNAWIEFLSKIATSRKEENLKPLSIDAMSKKYRAEKKKGMFASQSKNGPCSDNTQLLCAWNSSRGVTKPKEVEKLPEKEMSLLPVYPLDDRNDVPPDDRFSGGSNIYKDAWLTTVENLLPNFLYCYAPEGKGDLVVFQEKMTGAYLVVRIIEEDGTGAGGTELESMYGAQVEFEKRLGKRVPRVHFAYTIDLHGERFKVIGTDPIQGVVEDLTKRERRKHIDLKSLIKSLIELVDILKTKKLTHGDFQTSNISYRLCPDRKTVDYVGLIDFEFSETTHGDDLRQRTNLLRDAVNANLFRYLLDAGFKIPDWYLKLDKSIKGLKLQEYVANLLPTENDIGTSCKPIEMPTISI